MKLNERKTGLSLGLFIAGVHLVWSLLVALGWAQILIGWSFSWHMLSNPFTVQPFSLTNAIILIIVTFAVGNAVGYSFAAIWNKTHED